MKAVAEFVAIADFVIIIITTTVDTDINQRSPQP
jgi:hypothetical protein